MARRPAIVIAGLAALLLGACAGDGSSAGNDDAAPNDAMAADADGHTDTGTDAAIAKDADAISDAVTDTGVGTDAAMAKDVDAISDAVADTGTDAPCSGCLGQWANCHEACNALMGGTGHCEWPDSMDPGQCCVCTPLDPQCPDCTWPEPWSMAAANPVLAPKKSCASHGFDNVYAPDVIKVGDEYWMWYGGQGKDGHDRIFLATSSDLLTWDLYSSWGCPQPVVDVGASNHVNDPSVVLVGDTYYMFYTDAPVAELDRIALATSTDGKNWSVHGIVLDLGPAGTWDSMKVGRPAVIHEDGEFRMWYDGTADGANRHVGYAVSTDGTNWSRHPGNPVLLHQGAVDVERIGQEYVLLAEAGPAGVLRFTSGDRVTWSSQGKSLAPSGAAWDWYGIVTPNILSVGGEPIAMLFGGMSHECWCKNRIGVAFPVGAVDDCSLCLVGFETCAAACQAMGLTSGYCAHPGSTDPDTCCACT